MNFKKSVIISINLLSTIFAFCQEQIVLNSKYLPAEDTAFVFKPNIYENMKIIPAVILLHGWSGNYKQWNNIVDLQAIANEYNCIIICPDGFYDSWYIDSPLKKKWQFESFFIKDFIPYIFENYKVNRDSLFISGLSMGGHGALYLFFRYNELFKSAGSTSGVVDLTKRKINFGLVKLLGKQDKYKSRWDSFSVINNLPDSLNNKEIIFDCGSEDPFYDMNNDLRKTCIEKGMKATFISMPGKHNNEYWRKSINYHFAFFFRKKL